MATNKREFEKPKKWEILGAIFGYFAVAKDVPTVFKTLKISKLFPRTWKAYLLSVNPSQDFWYLIIFTLALVLTLLVLLWREKEKPAPQENKDNNDQTINELRKIQIIAHIKSLGISILRNWILDRIKVELYGTFRRPSTWEPRKGYYNWIDRITFNSGHGAEFQYSTNFTKISVREHPCDSNTYGISKDRKPTCKEIGLLLISSNFFPFWFFFHIFTRINKLEDNKK